MDYQDELIRSSQAALAARLRRARLAANLTQRELAQRAGVSLKTLANAEDGHNVSLETLLRLLQGLGRLSDIAAVLADDGPSPIELAARKGRLRQRARAGRSQDEGEWRW
ncbi:MAG: helix-turn-helix domain-containing protein [Woeseiaceae bacterium]|nr:helix-turn-helix domain-containing protein [Woeseiaceae bacterium]